MKTLKRFGNAKLGATSIEYAIIAGLVSLLVVAGARSIGANLKSNYFAPVSSNLT